jgi:hypothetical protein
MEKVENEFVLERGKESGRDGEGDDGVFIYKVNRQINVTQESPNKVRNQYQPNPQIDKNQ